MLKGKYNLLFPETLTYLMVWYQYSFSGMSAFCSIYRLNEVDQSGNKIFVLDLS